VTLTYIDLIHTKILMDGLKL